MFRVPFPWGAAMIVVECPMCGAKTTANQTHLDGTVDCPGCGHAISLAMVARTEYDCGMSPAEAEAARTLTVGGTTATGTTPAGAIHIPGYDVLEEVGRGGMGIVYKAKQHNPPRLVALKTIVAGEHADPEQLSRFRVEAEAIARLTHPTIAQIHQVGEWHRPDGGFTVPFLTLEFVDGPSLARRLRSGPPVSPKQAATLIRQLARAVHYAHEQGILHRDLKPSNILLADREGPDSLGNPKIVDFGLAKPLDGFASTVTEGPQTRKGAVLGTPSYMAPEQASGKSKVGPAADVYALGAVLYELLTGRPPFLGESEIETLLQVANEDAVPPRRIRPEVPRDLETICLCCLAKGPDRRYTSATALANDLSRFLDDRPVKVRPPSRFERLARWTRRRKELVYLAAGAVIALAVILAIALSRPAQTNEPVPGPAAQPPPPNPGPPGESPLSMARRRTQSMNKLKQLAVGLHSFHDTHGVFPPAAIRDDAGRPLLSWRVAILPFIELGSLYNEFRLQEPWDSEHNKKLIEKMPAVFSIGAPTGPASTTHYQAIVGPGTAWEGQPRPPGAFLRGGTSIPSFTDGTSNTILLVEAARPAIWTKPEELTFDGRQLPKLGGQFNGGYNVAMTDGAVRFLLDDIDPRLMRALLTRNGGETLPESVFGRSTFQSVEPVASSSGSITGVVTYNGRPLPGGDILFTGEGSTKGTSMRLTISADGTFRSGRVSVGTYAVTITPPRKPPPGFPTIPRKYSDVAASGLVVDILREGQTTNFALVGDEGKK